jgi:TatD DNase family protein
VLETDCPYMTPAPFRGKRNEPLYVEYVARKIAEIKNIDFETVAEITNKNTRIVYGISEEIK